MKEPAEAFRHIRRLQIKALRHVNDLFTGIYRSTFKGKGVEFEGVREYQPGDDIRSIDWNVTARAHHPFVKHFREERELTMMLVVDISASSHFSHIECFKSEMIAELAALLAFLAIKNQDRVGLLLFTEEIELYLKPNKGIHHVLRITRELLYFAPKHRGTDVRHALSFLGRVQRKRVICFLISDFLTGDFSLQAAFIAKRHELIAFHVFDAHEKRFFPHALLRLRDLETDEEAIVDTADPLVQQHFQRQAEEHDRAIKSIFERVGADYLQVQTGESSRAFLQRFFRLRRPRR